MTRKATLLRCIVVILCIGLSQSASAEWKGGVEGGTVVRDAGNASRVRLSLRNDERPFSQYIYAEWLRYAGDANNYAVGYNPRYWLNEKNYAFGETEYRTDDTLGIDREVRLTGGVGRRFLSTPVQELYAEVGLGGRSIGYTGVEGLSTDTMNEGFGLLRFGFLRSIADLARIDLRANASLSSEDTTEAGSEVGLAVRVPGGSVRLAYRSRYLKTGESDSITDDDTFISFGYDF